MENPGEEKGDERSCEVPKAGEEEKPKVENKEENKTERLSEKASGRKRSQDRERDRSRGLQSVRERYKRGERSRGGDRSAFKGSVYRPRSHPECRVYISNIPYEYRWQDLKDLFRNQVGEVSFVELFEDEFGKPQGSGIVEFEKVEHARKALDKMNRFDLKGRRLIVKEDHDLEPGGYGRFDTSNSGRNESRNEMPPPRSSGRGYSGDVDRTGMRYAAGSNIGTLASPSSTRWSNTYGLSPQFLDSLGISGPIFSRIFVANLDYKVDDAKLREVFRLAGKVIVAEVVKDRDGRSRGFGVVEMSHPIEAVQAISMFNNQMLFDRRMTVRMDREADRTEARSSRLPEGLRSIGMGLGDRGNPLHDLAPLGDRPSNVYGMDSVYGNQNANGQRDFMPPLDAGYGSLSGGAVMGGHIDRSHTELHSTRSSQSVSSYPLDDYRRTTLGSSYNLTSGSGTNISLNGITSSSSSNPYGYLTENMTSSTLTSVSDYDRRDAQGGYRTNQISRETRQEYPNISYEMTRVSSLGPSASQSLGPSGNSSSRMSDTIAVTNLPLNYTWQDLRDKFCEVGDVLFADIRTKGTGLVRFSSQEDAQRACSLLNRTRMEGHTIEVDFY